VTDDVLLVRGLVRSYGRLRAVDGLDLSVRSGEIFGFLGRNGAGKTTTIRMLMGLIRPDAGQIALLGDARRPLTVAQKRLIGYVAQEQHFYPWMSAAQLGRFVRGFYPQQWDDLEFDRLLGAFDLPPERKVGELSHGMRVKLALAIAIAPRPPLLILDEPTAGLDPVARREFLEIIQDHARAAGQTVFFSSHLIDEVERVADRVGIIDHGRAIYEGDLASLRASVRGLKLSPEELARLPGGFRVLRERSGEPATVMASPAAWAASPQLLAPGLRAELSLDDIFIALVGKGLSA
jgi:ABC-2 type transport system ATP-binding protein